MSSRLENTHQHSTSEPRTMYLWHQSDIRLNEALAQEDRHGHPPPPPSQVAEAQLVEREMSKTHPGGQFDYFGRHEQ